MKPNWRTKGCIWKRIWIKRDRNAEEMLLISNADNTNDVMTHQ